MSDFETYTKEEFNDLVKITMRQQRELIEIRILEMIEFDTREEKTNFLLHIFEGL